MSLLQRRTFLKHTAAATALTILHRRYPYILDVEECQTDKWRAMMTDPVYEMAGSIPDLDRILDLFPGQRGEPAFDPALIKSIGDKLTTVPSVNTGHPFMDTSVRTALAHIDATFQGDHPKYGVGSYGHTEHDGFPPVIISATDALSSWGLNQRAVQLFRYWLMNFVKADGTFNYYGPSLSEYGQILHTAKILEERAGGDGWLKDCLPKLDLVAEYLLGLAHEASKADDLISGVPEADTRDQVAKYFHNNAWVARGLQEWIVLCSVTNFNSTSPFSDIGRIAKSLKEKTLSSVRGSWPVDPQDWWLQARTGNTVKPHSLTDGDEASYTNYRYWPELLSSGILPPDLAIRLVNARLAGGGQFCGMTRFQDHLDDWPLTDYLYALWAMDRKEDFFLSLFGHIAYHQCRDHLTAYEQFNFPGDPRGSKVADYCLPCQLVAARAGRLINNRG